MGALLSLESMFLLDIYNEMVLGLICSAAILTLLEDFSSSNGDVLGVTYHIIL